MLGFGRYHYIANAWVGILFGTMLLSWYPFKKNCFLLGRSRFGVSRYFFKDFSVSLMLFKIQLFSVPILPLNLNQNLLNIYIKINNLSFFVDFFNQIYVLFKTKVLVFFWISSKIQIKDISNNTLLFATFKAFLKGVKILILVLRTF